MNRNQNRKGVALILVLASLLLLSVLVISLVFRLSNYGKWAHLLSASESSQEAAEFGMAYLVEQIREDFREGSTLYQEVMEPKTARQSLLSRWGTGVNDEMLYQISTPADVGSAWVREGARAKISDHSTDQESSTGSVLSASYWNKPLFLKKYPSERIPHWMYVDEKGPVDTSSINPGQNAYRIAYSIYHTGGLLEANQAGFKTGTIDKNNSSGFNKVNLLQYGVELNALPGFNPEIGKTLYQWRDGASNSSPNAFLDWFFRLDRVDQISFQSDNRFQGRKDLLQFLKAVDWSEGGQYLNVGNVFANWVSWKPQDPTGSMIQYESLSAQPKALNPDVNRLSLTAPLKRFNLNRINLLASDAVNGSESSLIYQYFGLKRSNSTQPWEYRNGAIKILTLSEVVQQHRDPDFFEMLQAAVLHGSTGKSGGNTATLSSDYRDSEKEYQIMAMGANIIDQYDSDDDPTAIQYDNKRITVYGVENLPYINEMITVCKRNAAVPTTVESWLQFELWNPNQNAQSTAGQGLKKLRINIDSGKVVLQCAVNNAPPAQLSALMNLSGKNLSFVSDIKFSEPCLVGIASGSSSSTQRMTVASMGSSSPTDGVDGILLGKQAGFALYAAAAGDWSRLNTTFQTVGGKTGTQVTFSLQYQKNGQWVTYQKIEDWNYSPTNKSFGDFVDANWANINPLTVGATSRLPYAYAMRGSLAKVDPRTPRFGLSAASQTVSAGGGSRILGVWDKKYSSINPNQHVISNWDGYDFAAPGVINTNASGLVLTPGFNYLLSKGYGTFGGPFVPIAGFCQNSPNLNDCGVNYTDPDGVMRPGDWIDATVANPGSGDCAYPMLYGRYESRPVILNRPFKNVGELGYVFRDTPWKSFDFFSTKSADSGLLDFFCCQETEINDGGINLNLASKPVIESVLRGSVKKELSQETLTDSQVQTIAQTIESNLKLKTTKSPLSNRSDLVSYLASEAGLSPVSKIKTEREAVIRALSEVSDFRTQNLLIDLTAEVGKFSRLGREAKDFTPQARTRVWYQIGVDRYTGKLIYKRKEWIE